MAKFAQPNDVAAAFVDALNEKNADALGELFREDAEFVNIKGQRMHGRKGIIKGHAQSFAGPLKGLEFAFEQVDELRVTKDVVVLHVHCRRAGLVGSAPEEPTLEPTVLELVLVNGPEGWLAAAGTNVVQASALPVV
jgi:uncharacterized protein (TIGR02246 family)